jgi:tetratricopeptide (TPR) repeat protein/tRNA A-37 threonylcarbamoyl transferase component Bud32
VAEIIERLNRALAGRYAIQRELRRGGMAIVYLAEDLKHQRRRVAIKVLEPELSVLLGPDRFLREIEIAARLQHPHILTLLDSGDAEGLLYYVMPYVAGESLRERLNRERELPVEDALRLAREVADALDYAHREGVVHRDIKPDNILLQAGHAVVADFGIAHAVGAAGGSKLTTAGTVLGTPAYMSPEQVLGNQELDGRSDVYSLACVLYEMLAGVPPFAGANLTHQHLSVVPPPVTSARPAVSEAIARALAKALAKTPADRFGTASQFAEALFAAPRPQRLRIAAVAAAVGAIVVALVVFPPKPSHPPDPSKKAWMLVAEFDGPAADSTAVSAIRDLVIAALEQSEIVTTVPRDQIKVALQMAGKPSSTRVDAELARELAYRSAVRTVLEGQVGRLGKGYSVVLRLVDADSARVVLSVSDAAPDEAALIPTVGRIAKRLRAGLGERPSALEATRPLNLVMTPSFEAYKIYARARELLFGNENRAAITLYQSALALDPDFAPAWGGIGWCFTNLGEPDSAIAAFHQALARRERLPEGARFYIAAALATLNGGNRGALAQHEQIIRLYPQSWTAHNNQATCLSLEGRLNEALESTWAAEKVSPFGASQQVLNNRFVFLLQLGRVDEARRLAPRLSGSNGVGAPMRLARASGQWAAAESLATVLGGGAASDDALRADAGRTLAAAQASRGQVSAAEQTLRQAQSEAESAHETLSANRTRWTRLALDLFSLGVSGNPGDPGSWDSTTAGLVNRGLWAAATGDTTLARRLLATIRKRSAPDLARQGFTPAVLEAWIAARAGRWQEVVQDLGPAALQGEARGYVLIQSAPLVRWLVAEAYEHLDRPDSAAAYFERTVAPVPLGGTDFSQSRMAFAFGHQRLVLLYARMGRAEEARRHWEIFSGTFTRPDPELAPRLAEARAALAGAEGMARSARR